MGVLQSLGPVIRFFTREGPSSNEPACANSPENQFTGPDEGAKLEEYIEVDVYRQPSADLLR